MEQNLYRVFTEMLDMNSLGLDCQLDADDEGLCCPLELHNVLTECYRQADESLLEWLKGARNDFILYTLYYLNTIYYFLSSLLQFTAIKPSQSPTKTLN